METVVNIGCVVFMLITNLIIWYNYVKLAKRKESDYFTDYVNKEQILRVVKYENEFKAVEGVKHSKILDAGNLDADYKWYLIEK